MEQDELFGKSSKDERTYETNEFLSAAFEIDLFDEVDGLELKAEKIVSDDFTPIKATKVSDITDGYSFFNALVGRKEKEIRAKLEAEYFANSPAPSEHYQPKRHQLVYSKYGRK